MPDNSCLTHLSCWKTGKQYDADRLINVSDAGKPLRVEYDLRGVAETLDRDILATRPRNLWAWRELLPLPFDIECPTLGEGGTPLLEAERLGRELGLRRLYVKDEAVNPTGSFKARGMAVAVAMAKYLGAPALAVPSAGNAGGALAAYAARVGLAAHIFMPQDVPAANRLECELAGAHVTLVDGLITDCAARVRAGCAEHGWFDLSTLKEPYRVEGKKTMGLEIARQLDWNLPDVIIYPTGGGTGLVGMHKAFAELEAIGWLDAQQAKRPRFVAVQAEGCCPIVSAFAAGADEAVEHENAHTVAAGLRVPKAIGDFIMLDILRSTNGTAIAVSDAEMIRAARELSAATGVCACPEGGACLAALRKLRDSGWVRDSDEVVLFNTGSGLKYAEAFAGGTT
ncbi:MAG: threonine synthase [Planctomycetes bacterium]|nr:threonine synthase [Planctomycetota bacterium]